MSEGEGQDPPTEAELRDVVALQAQEIERLRRRLEDERFAAELREALTVSAAAGTIASPVTHSRLLEMIVETAAQVISARAASLFLIDESRQELVFEVALGQQADEVKRFRVPIGHGIAGLVALTGQPMAISDASSDPRQAADIAQSVGYAPENILCVPLFYHDQITGVLELLDKEGAPSFTPADMELLGLFANQAAVAIELSQTHRNLAGLLVDMLAGTGNRAGDGREGQAYQLVTGLEQDEVYRRAIDLARLVQEIVQRGDDEAQACATILRGFAEYLRARPSSFAEVGVGW